MQESRTSLSIHHPDDARSGCLFALGELDFSQIQFSETLWKSTVERVTMYADERRVFRFRKGAEVAAEM